LILGLDLVEFRIRFGGILDWNLVEFRIGIWWNLGLEFGLGFVEFWIRIWWNFGLEFGVV